MFSLKTKNLLWLLLIIPLIVLYVYFVDSESPLWLLLIIPLIVLYAYFLQCNEKKKKEAMNFSEVETAKSIFGKNKKSGLSKLLFNLSFISILLIIIGLSNPNLLWKQTNEGVSIVFAIDNSFTMDNIEENGTRRIELAKDLVEELINRLDSTDYVGVITFAESQFTSSCLSGNHEYSIYKLRDIKVNRREYSFLGDGLTSAINQVSMIPNKNKRVILISDGVNAEQEVSEDEKATLLKYAKSEDVKVYAIGIGSDMISIYSGSEDGKVDSVEYLKVNKKFLKEVSEESGGKYFDYKDWDSSEDVKTSIYKDVQEDKLRTNVKDVFFAVALILSSIVLICRFGPSRILQ